MKQRIGGGCSGSVHLGKWQETDVAIKARSVDQPLTMVSSWDTHALIVSRRAGLVTISIHAVNSAISVDEPCKFPFMLTQGCHPAQGSGTDHG